MRRTPFDPNLVSGPAEENRPRGLLSVTRLTAMIKRALDDALPPTVHVVGEISNFKRHSSGHLYLTLKDAHAELSCVCWRSAAGHLKFSPTDGLEVIATGHVEVFERAGRYQLYIRKLEPRGIGALELAFRQLCEKLASEGLFDEEPKQPIPLFPARLAMMTSPTGAAIVDMLRTIRQRFPCLDILVYPVRVQGAGAAEEIAGAIRRLNQCRDQLGGIDVLIVGRGGGSLEDLWAFNEEVVARAIFASRIPIISAVGHAVDVTIADLVADARVATPTAAAELAVPVLAEVLGDLKNRASRIGRAAGSVVELGGARFERIQQRPAFGEPERMVLRRAQVVDELLTRQFTVMHNRISRFRSVLDRNEPTLQRIAPHTLLLGLTDRLRYTERLMDRALHRRLASAQLGAGRSAHRLVLTSPDRLLPRAMEQLRHLSLSLPWAIARRLMLLSDRVRHQEELLQALSYKSVLGRGFSITRRKKGHTTVRSLADIKDRDRILTELADGEFESEVLNLRQLELFD